MFVDKVRIIRVRRPGGDGAVAFHREKYVAAAVPTAATAVTAAAWCCTSTPTSPTLLVSATSASMWLPPVPTAWAVA